MFVESCLIGNLFLSGLGEVDDIVGCFWDLRVCMKEGWLSGW